MNDVDIVAFRLKSATKTGKRLERKESEREKVMGKGLNGVFHVRMSRQNVKKI